MVGGGSWTGLQGGTGILEPIRANYHNHIDERLNTQEPILNLFEEKRISLSLSIKQNIVKLYHLAYL